MIKLSNFNYWSKLRKISSNTIKSQIRYCYVVLSLELYLFPISCFKEARRRKIAAIYKMLVIKECCKITKKCRPRPLKYTFILQRNDATAAVFCCLRGGTGKHDVRLLP